MKILIAALLIIAASTVHAADVNLTPMQCTATNLCFAVQNDAGLEVGYISDAIQYRRLIVQVGDQVYDSGLYALDGSLNQTNVPLIDAATGQTLYATLRFTVTTGKCVRQGRVTVCPRSVHLDSGVLVTPQ